MTYMQFSLSIHVAPYMVLGLFHFVAITSAVILSCDI